MRGRARAGLATGAAMSAALAAIEAEPGRAQDAPAARVDFRVGRHEDLWGDDGPNARSVALLDLDGDGRLDVVVANRGDGTICQLLNLTPRGSRTVVLSEPVFRRVGSATANLVVADVNGDGRLDLIVTRERSFQANPGVRAAEADGLWLSPALDVAAGRDGAEPLPIAAGDLDGSGRPSVVHGYVNAPFVQVSANGIGRERWSFRRAVELELAAPATSLAIGDVTSDGLADIVVACPDKGVVSVFVNRTERGKPAAFARRTDVALGGRPVAVALGDWDGDGRLCVVVADEERNVVRVLRSRSDARGLRLEPSVELAAGDGPVALELADVDGDGRLDAAVANMRDDTAVVLFGGGRRRRVFRTGPSPRALALGDLDGDGRPELAVVNAGDRKGCVLRVD